MAGMQDQDRRENPPLSVLKKVKFSSDKGQTSLTLQIKKSVSFNEEFLEEIIEFEDDDVSKLGRKMYWEFKAVDRQRFMDRIKAMEDVLSPVLIATHRTVVCRRMSGIPEGSKPMNIDSEVRSRSVGLMMKSSS